MHIISNVYKKIFIFSRKNSSYENCSFSYLHQIFIYKISEIFITKQSEKTLIPRNKHGTHSGSRLTK